MRFALILVSLLCSVAFCANADAAAPKKNKSINSRKLGLVIRVEGDDWGRARKAQIETVLYAVADELLTRLPQKFSAPIVVSHTDKNPVALYDRGPGGEYRVHLHASGERWYLYAYEFAHEFCHLMSNYEENLAPDRRRDNQWFEEALCETASLYTLKSLAATWEASPPAPEWSRQARYLRDYFELLIGEQHRRLPAYTQLASWMGGHGEQLRHDPYQREKNQVVANQLLPLFEDEPGSWDALCYLNLDPADAHNELPQYLHNWYDHVPTERKQFVGRVLALLAGAELPPVETASDAPAAPVGALAYRTADSRHR